MQLPFLLTSRNLKGLQLFLHSMSLETLWAGPAISLDRVCSYNWEHWGTKYTDASMVLAGHEPSQTHYLVPRHEAGRSGSRGNDRPSWEGSDNGCQCHAPRSTRIPFYWRQCIPRLSGVDLQHCLQEELASHPGTPHYSHCLGAINPKSGLVFFLLVWPLMLNDETSMACGYKSKH